MYFRRRFCFYRDFPCHLSLFFSCCVKPNGFTGRRLSRQASRRTVLPAISPVSKAKPQKQNANQPRNFQPPKLTNKADPKIGGSALHPVRSTNQRSTRQKTSAYPPILGSHADRLQSSQASNRKTHQPRNQPEPDIAIRDGVLLRSTTRPSSTMRHSPNDTATSRRFGFRPTPPQPPRPCPRQPHPHRGPTCPETTCPETTPHSLLTTH